MPIGPTEYFWRFFALTEKNDTATHHFSDVISDSYVHYLRLYEHQKKVRSFQIQATKK
jgi:hypothetical protein